MAAPRKTPEEMYSISRGFVDDHEYGARPWLERHLEAKKYAHALHNLGSLQVNLYFLALMQLRWGYDGLRETMDELDSLPQLFDTAYREVRAPWSFDSCRLDAHLRLNYLLDRPTVQHEYYRKWVEATSLLDDATVGYRNWNCTHKHEIAVEQVLTEGGQAESPCDFPTSKRYALNASTYKNYLDLANAVAAGDQEQAEARLAEGIELYARRARGDAGDGYLGYDGNNYYLFDFQLAAVAEFARRTNGWELPVDERHAAALRNAAIFREENRSTG